MALRDWLLENFAGDLDYDPRRGVFYAVAGVLAIATWTALRGRSELAVTQSIMGLGGLALLVKAVFLFRKRSAGFGTDAQSLVDSSKAQTPPTPLESGDIQSKDRLARRTAQFVQDFAVGPLLLWSLVGIGHDSDPPGSRPNELLIFLSGVVLFAVGWIGSHFTQSEGPPRG